MFRFYNAFDYFIVIFECCNPPWICPIMRLKGRLERQFKV